MIRSLKRAIALLIGLVLFHQVLFRIIRKFVYRFPVPRVLNWHLDSKFRKRQQPPDQVIVRSGVRRGMTVLEVGCGSGAYTLDVARAVGPEGAVYALDAKVRQLHQLEDKLKLGENADIENIHIVESSAYELPFDDQSFDAVYFISVLQEIPDRPKSLDEARRVLKPGGTLAITEFLPDPDYPLRSTTLRLGERCGFVLDEIEGNFFNYTVRFINPAALTTSVSEG